MGSHTKKHYYFVTDYQISITVIRFSEGRRHNVVVCLQKLDVSTSNQYINVDQLEL